MNGSESLTGRADPRRVPAITMLLERCADIRTQLSGLGRAFEDTGHAIALLTGDGVVLRANDALGRAVGAEPREVVGRRWDSLIGSGSCLVGDLIAGGRAQARAECRVAGAHGAVRWLDVSASWIGERRQGRRARMAVHVVDVTERKRAELALGESEERFRTAFEETTIGMAIFDVDGTVLRINAALEQVILGYATEELVGRSIFDLTHADDRLADLEAADLLLSGTRSCLEHERRYRHRNGSWVWCQLNLSAVHGDRGVTQFVVQVQDVRQRRAVEHFLRESEDRYRSLVEHLPLVTFRDGLDEHGCTLFVSPQVAPLLGHPVQDWLDDPHLFARTVHPDDRARVMAEVARANAALDDLVCEFRVVAPDGRVATLRKEGVVVRDDAGVPLYRQGFLADVTDRRALEEQLRLAQKLESVGQLAAGIAHEINTPVQFIGDSVAFVREGVDDLMALIGTIRDAAAEVDGPGGDGLRAAMADAEADTDLAYLADRLPGAFERTSDGIERVAEIVRAIKAFAHPSTGAHAPVDVNGAVRTTLLVAKAEYKYVADVELCLDDGEPFVLGDPGELNQALLNLVVNAAHAIAEATTGEERGTIRITTARDGDRVRVTVADSGTGIDEETRRRIFDPFFTTKPLGQGTGQGLAITHAIVVDKHGGAIEVQSARGAGTTMTISLPALAEAAPAEGLAA